MSETRSGEGPAVSRTAGKEAMGRTFITANHEGQLARNTEYQAGKRLANIGVNEGPTDTEVQMVFQENPSDVKAFKASGMTRLEIYEALKNR